MTHDMKFLADIRHPEYLEDQIYWADWREAYNAGPRFVQRNLKQFSNRETAADFESRKFYTPIPSYARAAVNDVRNSIFQRLRDVTRRDGSEAYMQAASGEIGGVDNKGTSMQSFLGIDVLTDLLIMGRVGVYVDMPQLSGLRTLADEGSVRPYCYYYQVEDILSWSVTKPEEPGDFTSILLRDRGVDYNQGFAKGAYLPSGSYTRYRFMWIDPDSGKVNMKLTDEKDMPLTFDGLPVKGEGVTTLDLDRIPFTMLDIKGSLLKDVYKHQIALLNLGSSDVAYALKANFPFYTEQQDTRATGAHLKQTVADDGTTTTSDNSKAGQEARTGVSHGRTYDLKAERPGFIHPSSEPLMASIKLQEKLEDDIRKLVNLAVQNKTGQRAVSAEAMKLSDQGLEAGLSYIGLILEGAERRIAEHWAAYENKNASQRQIATVKYPDRYSLKDDGDRIIEAKELADLMYTVPGTTVKKELSKNIVSVLLAGRVAMGTIDTIFGEIDTSEYTTSDPETIIRAQEAGLCGEQTASQALGFSEDEYLQAREDHVSRAVRILEAQTKIQAEAAATAQGMAPPAEGEAPAARGVKDLDTDTESGKEEKVTEVTLTDDKRPPVRGEGKSLDKGDRSSGS